MGVYRCQPIQNSTRELALWKFETEVLLKGRGLFELVTGVIPIPKDGEEGRNKWVILDAKAQELIVMRMQYGPLAHIQMCGTAAEMWSKLKTVYERVCPAKACPAGFGASVPRFGKITVHPSLDASGLYTKREPGCDPCLYHPVPMNEVYRINKNRTDAKDVWRYKAEMEDWSKNLGYRNQAILRQRRRIAAQGGPAWCTPHELSKYKPACNNVGFGRAPRFRPIKTYVPPPGTYYRAVPFTAPYGPHSTLPSFEWEDPCRFKDTVPRWSLAPDRYTIIDKESIEMKSKKVVSLRGPYDLFTGTRDKCFKKLSAATWPLALPGSFEKFKRTRLGVMNKTGRDKPYRGRSALVDIAMCYRSPKDPGPAEQNIVKPRVFKRYMHGFNSSYDRPPGYKRVVVWPGVGRYKDQVVSCGILGQGHKHVFLSKEQRTIGAVIPQPMNTF